MVRAANLCHWSGQWVEFLHSQHLRLFCLVSISPLALRWLTWRWLVDRTGTVAGMRDFISTDIHSMSTFSVADFPSRAISHNPPPPPPIRSVIQPREKQQWYVWLTCTV